ncbi:hypothetical protein [Rhizobium sp.]|uniref:hypothetical protein n=1 Tax=Rhizobium sp. TaxID=391 RepID=UPI0034C66116
MTIKGSLLIGASEKGGTNRELFRTDAATGVPLSTSFGGATIAGVEQATAPA